MSQQPSENPQTPPVEPQTPVDRFFAAASTGLTQWWRWVLGVIVTVFIWQIGALVLVMIPGFACIGHRRGHRLPLVGSAPAEH